MATKNYRIPFDKHGNMIGYVGYVDETEPIIYHLDGQVRIEWRENYEFFDYLALLKWSKGRSSATVQVADKHSRTYNMFFSDFFKVAQTQSINRGIMSGHWTFQKKGMNYGIRLA